MIRDKSDLSPLQAGGRLRGFTLVELLIVTAIIALLIALLLPVLNKARQQAMSVQCASNLRQCTMALLLYANNNNNQIITGCWWGADRWWAAYLGGYDCMGNPGAPVYLNHSITQCPAELFSQNYSMGAMIQQYPPAGFGFNNNDQVTYGINDYGKNPAPPFQIQAFIDPAVSTNYISVQKLSHLTNGFNSGNYAMASNTVLLADDMQAQTFFGYYPPGGEFAANTTSYNNVNWHAAIHLLHNGRANCAFYDGHVELLSDHEMRYTGGHIREFVGPTATASAGWSYSTGAADDTWYTIP